MVARKWIWQLIIFYVSETDGRKGLINIGIMAETVFFWMMLRVVEEEEWKVDLGEDVKEMMDISSESIAEIEGHLGKIILDSRCGYKFEEDIMDDAARSGHLNIVQWLHANWIGGCSKNAMNWAARNGHLDVVIWLHENRTEGCSEMAMDRAAWNGHLDMVKWLHENRTEGCSKNAMNWAARNGYLDVVKWLHANRTEGCSKYAMNWAAKNGHLDVVEWLHENGYGV